MSGGGGELDDSGITAAVTVDLGTGTASDIGGALSAITNFVGNSAGGNTLDGPNAANTWLVPTTDSGTLSSLGYSTPFTFSGFSILTGGSVADIFTVSNDHSTSGITGTLTIIGGTGTNRLIVDDTGSTSAEAAIITSTSITGLSGGGTIDYSGGTFTDGVNNDGILVAGSSAASTYAIQSTLAGSTTKIEGGAGNEFLHRLGSNHLTSGIAGQLTIDAGAGAANRLIVDDSGSNSAEAAVITTSSITGLSGGTAGDRLLRHRQFSPMDANNDGILIEEAAAGGSFNIQSTLSGSTTQIDGDGTNDIFNVSSNAGTDTGNVAGISGTLSVVGGSGSNNRLTISDVGDTSSDAGVTITSNSISSLAPATIYYSATGSFLDSDSAFSDGILIEGASSSGNSFNIQSTLAGSTTQIDE